MIARQRDGVSVWLLVMMLWCGMDDGLAWNIQSRNRFRPLGGHASLSVVHFQTILKSAVSLDENTTNSTAASDSSFDSSFKTKNQQRWAAKIKELQVFSKQHGHLNVPKDDTHRELSTFVRNCRSQYRYYQNPEKRHLSFLTNERIQELESLGFVWNSHAETWQLRFQELVDFSDRYGHTNVPAKWTENPKLASWVAFQRHKYKTQQLNHFTVKDDIHNSTVYRGKDLTDQQIQALESIGFSWQPKQEVWWTMYQHLKDFYTDHGHLKVPQHYPLSTKLPQWMAHQRRHCRQYVTNFQKKQTTVGVHVSGLNPQRLAALREIGFCWLPDPDAPFFEPPPDDIFEGYSC